MTTRRRFFSIMGAAPLAAKGAAEQAAKSLAGQMSGFSVFNNATDVRGAISGYLGNTIATESIGTFSALTKEVRDSLFRKALNTLTSRRELESILYEEHRNIGVLDYDLAANRSMSFAAKVTFQRQRIVQRAIEQAVMEKTTYQRLQDWKSRALEFAGIKLSG